MHLSLTQGLWRHNLWGEPPILSVPSGAELAVWYNDIENKELIDTLWPQTTRSLSGLFCSSLNFINNQISIQPVYSMRSNGHLFFNKTNSVNNLNELNKRIKYATLPNEIVCTENLTPWLKLLPCAKYKGLSQLFSNPSKLFDTSYNSIGVHFRHICLVRVSIIFLNINSFIRV